MFKKYFSAGLLFWIPLAITVWILNMIVDFGDHLLNLTDTVDFAVSSDFVGSAAPLFRASLNAKYANG